MSGFGDTEPTEQQKALVDEALYLRGRIIASYAQVEFLLADLVVKLDLRFPHLIESRIRPSRKSVSGRWPNLDPTPVPDQVRRRLEQPG